DVPQAASSTPGRLDALLRAVHHDGDDRGGAARLGDAVRVEAADDDARIAGARLEGADIAHAVERLADGVAVVVVQFLRGGDAGAGKGAENVARDLLALDDDWVEHHRIAALRRRLAGRGAGYARLHHHRSRVAEGI